MPTDITSSGLRVDVNKIINYGERVRFRFFTVSGGSASYDDQVGLVISGTDYWTSGLVQPLSSKWGSYEALQVQQGKLLTSDIKLYVDGLVPTSGTFKVGIGGSPPTREYALTGDGVMAFGIGNELVYKKLYLRMLNAGSLNGE